MDWIAQQRCGCGRAARHGRHTRCLLCRHQWRSATPPSVCVCGACVVRKCRLSAGCSTLNCERPLRILPNKLLESLLPFYSSCICVIPRLIMSRDVAGCDCHDGLVKVYCVPELRSVSVTVTRHTREARHESNGHKRVFRILHRKMVLKQGIPFSLQAD
jgi:hypothetical protein